MAVSAAVLGVPVAGGEDGGATCPPATGPPNMRTQVRVRAKDGSENGALGHVESRLAIALRHSLRFPPFLHLQAPFFFFFFLLSRPPLAVADLLRLLRSRPQHHPWSVSREVSSNPDSISIFNFEAFFFFFSITSMFKIAVFLWLCSSDRFSTVHAVDDGCGGGALRYSGNLRRSVETVS